MVSEIDYKKKYREALRLLQNCLLDPGKNAKFWREVEEYLDNELLSPTPDPLTHPPANPRLWSPCPPPLPPQSHPIEYPSGDFPPP